MKSGEDACLAVCNRSPNVKVYIVKGVAFGSGIGNLEEIVSTGIALTDTVCTLLT